MAAAGKDCGYNITKTRLHFAALVYEFFTETIYWEFYR